MIQIAVVGLRDDLSSLVHRQQRIGKEQCCGHRQE